MREKKKEKIQTFFHAHRKVFKSQVGESQLQSMGSCSLGALNTGIVYIGSPRIRISKSCIISGRRAYAMQMQNISSFSGLTVSRRLEQACVVCCSPSAREDAMEASEAYGELESSSLASQFIPTSTQVESLLTDICDTSVAEFELKLSGFRLYVARDTTREPVNPPAPSFASASVHATNLTPPDANGSLSKTSSAISKPLLLSDGKQTFLNRATDEGLVFLKSPRVGFFRRSRTIKGKRAPPACKENQIVKEGQVICYIEQLGGEIPIESDVSGEIVRILLKDGNPVGYGDALISILPSFPGIKKLQ